MQHGYQSAAEGSIDSILTGQHGVIRIYVFKRINFSSIGPWALTDEDACKIFHRYQMQPTMIHRLKAFEFSAEPISKYRHHLCRFKVPSRCLSRWRGRRAMLDSHAG